MGFYFVSRQEILIIILELHRPVLSWFFSWKIRSLSFKKKVSFRGSLALSSLSLCWYLPPTHSQDCVILYFVRTYHHTMFVPFIFLIIYVIILCRPLSISSSLLVFARSWEETASGFYSEQNRTRTVLPRTRTAALLFYAFIVISLCHLSFFVFKPIWCLLVPWSKHWTKTTTMIVQPLARNLNHLQQVTRWNQIRLRSISQ